MILWEYIKSKMLKYPEQTIGEGNVKMRYDELCAFAEAHAKNLTAEYYGILCKSEMAATMAFLACIAAGKTAVPMPARYGNTYLKILDRVDPPYIITDALGGLNEIYMDPKKSFVFEGESPAVILFTSGSTGMPKGIMLSEKNLLANIKDISNYFEINEDDTILISRPIYHSSVLTGELLTALCKGCKVVFCSEAFQPAKLINMIYETQTTVFGSTPTLLATLSRFAKDWESVKSIRVLSISGEIVPSGSAERIRKAFPQAKIYCGYGLSEASPRVAYLPPEHFDKDPTAAGIALPSVKIRIVNEKNNDVKKGNVGEIVVKGDNVMMSYWNDSELTRKVVKKKWLYTGDVGYFDKRGFLYIKGRKDNMIIRAGMNIYPAEIENAISSDARVKELFVYGYNDGGTNQIALKISGDFNAKKDVLDLCKAKLPAYQVPSRIEIVDEVDKTNSGKKNLKNNAQSTNYTEVKL